jgi:hypothetical protein
VVVKGPARSLKKRKKKGKKGKGKKEKKEKRKKGKKEGEQNQPRFKTASEILADKKEFSPDPSPRPQLRSEA